MSSVVPMDSWKEYADTVWREFTKRSGKPERLMACTEWDVLREWLYAGVPLRVVLTAMSETRGRPRSLTYYEPSVRDEYERWRQAMTA
jgi:hypothetical protein